MIKVNIEDFLKRSVEIKEKITKASKLYGQTVGKNLVKNAKEDAPWTDRTSLSRNTIDNEVVSRGSNTYIKLRGNTPQFVYLELCHEKKNAILAPTIQKHRSEIIKGWAKVIKGN